MVTSRQLKEYSEQCISTIDKSQLTDISTVKVDENLSHEEKVLSYIEQAGNPYCFMCGETCVKIRFKENGTNIEDAVGRYLASRCE